MIHTIRQFELMPVPTTGTILCCVGGINFYTPSTGPFCLLLDETKKLSPRHVTDRSVYAAKAIFLHIVDGKVFNDNGVKFINYFTGFLMGEVFTLPAGSFVNTGNHFPGFGSKLRSFGLLGKFSLGFGKVLLFVFKKPWVLNILPIGKSGERGKPHVNSDSRIDEFDVRHMVNNTRESRIPFAGRRSSDGTSFNLSLDRSVEFDFNVSDLGKLKGIVEKLKTRLRIGERIVSKFSTKARIARFSPCLASAEEGTEGKINAHGNILKRLTENIVQERMLFFKRRNRAGLIISGKTFLFGFPSCFSLLKKIVIEPAATIKRTIKLFQMVSIWENPIFKGLSHIIYTIRTNMRNVNKNLERTAIHLPAKAGSLLAVNQ